MSYKNKLSTLGFTLIELLVVISIIGLISTIVLVSTKGSRDKARLAKVKQFSSQVNHALGAYAVGIWRFEEGEGIDIHDESGYGNHGTFHGNPTPVFPDGVYSGTTALQFDGVDDYVDCGNDESLNITDEITISAWIYSIGEGVTWHGIISKGNGQPYALTFNRPNRYLHFETHGGPGTLNTSVNTILFDKWTYVVATYNGSMQKIYINGIEKASRSASTDLVSNSESLRVGQGNNGEFFKGRIDEVRIYNRALSASEIRKHYAAGAAKHGIAVNNR